MHLLILGLILVVGILVYYIMTSGSGSRKSSDGKKSKIKRSSDDAESRVPDDLRKEGNVVFLPTANQETQDQTDPADQVDPADQTDSMNDSDSDPDQNA